MGKGVIDERDSAYLGTLAISSRDYIHCVVDEADLIIVVGYDLEEKIPFLSKMSPSGEISRRETKILHINFFQTGVSTYYAPTYEVVGDIGNAVWRITEMLKKKFWQVEKLISLRTQVKEKVEEGNTNESFPILPQRIVRDVRSVVPDDGIVCLDNGMYKLWFARAYQVYEPNTLLLDNALATMGAGLPSAIATKIIHPDRFVMVICGDGGFMMNSQEIETAIRLKLDLVILIINDNGFGMIQWEQEEKKYNSFGLKFSNPDFVKYAESYGAHGIRIESADGLGPAITRARTEGSVWIIDVPVDYRENHKVFTSELNNNTCEF